MLNQPLHTTLTFYSITPQVEFAPLVGGHVFQPGRVIPKKIKSASLLSVQHMKKGMASLTSQLSFIK